MQITNTLPSSLSFVSCAIGAPYSGTCAKSGSNVAYQLSQTVPAGATGYMVFTTQAASTLSNLITNTVSASFKDSANNYYGPVQASAAVSAASPTAVKIVTVRASAVTAGSPLDKSSVAGAISFGVLTASAMLLILLAIGRRSLESPTMSDMPQREGRPR